MVGLRPQLNEVLLPGFEDLLSAQDHGIEIQSLRSIKAFARGSRSRYSDETVLSTRVAIVHNPGMNRQSSYRGYRFPSEIISQAVWLYHRFTLSFRDIEDLLAERGVIVTYESIRQWCMKFGPNYANQLRKR